MNDKQVTQRFLFSGRVQGVGFRWTAQRIAARHPVNGYVRNLSDGRVEMVAQGIEPAIVDLLSEIKTAMSDNIEGVVGEDVQASELYGKFVIRR